MKTTVWTKLQPKKKLEYPDCYPTVVEHLKSIIYLMNINKDHSKAEASFMIENINRVEFRP